jgi:FPC/CPF motif-containing protein YcgG
MLFRLPTFEARVIGPRDLAEIPADAWFARAAHRLIQTVQDTPHFPCHFATLASQRGALFFSDAGKPQQLATSSIVEDLRTFLAFYRSLPLRSAVVVFVDTRTTRSLQEDEDIFWSVLSHLRDRSSTPPRTDYDDPDWHFCFDDEELFFNGHSPHYRNRISRRSDECLSIVIQTRFNLRHVSGSTPAAVAVSDQIRSIIDRYDDIPRSPYLGPHFDWRQFWLLDDNGADRRRCPLGVRPRLERT